MNVEIINLHKTEENRLFSHFEELKKFYLFLTVSGLAIIILSYFI